MNNTYMCFLFFNLIYFHGLCLLTKNVRQLLGLLTPSIAHVAPSIVKRSLLITPLKQGRN